MSRNTQIFSARSAQSEGKFKLTNRIHGKRQHQQGIVVALIGE
jgi:hypothetical protein